MIIFDSGFLYAYINDKDRNYKKATSIMKKAFKGEYGKMVISNYIIDEVLTLARVRTRNCKVNFQIHAFINEKKDGDEIFYKIIVNQTLMDKTQEYYSIYCEKGLSYTDCSILACAKEYDIEYVASFDKGFKGIVNVLPD